MRRSLLIAVMSLLPVMRVCAGDAGAVSSGKDAQPPDMAVSTDETPASKWKTSYELDADTSYVGDALTKFGPGGRGQLSEERTRAHFVISPQYNDEAPLYRFGLAYQRYSFGLSKAAPLPDELESMNVIVGADFTVFNSWIVRVEADPGFYGDGRNIGYRTFNVPFLIGGSYIVDEHLQWVLGIDVDLNRQIPVYPAVGVRWAFTDNWVIDAILPKPRLEYDYSKALTLYAGAEVDDGSGDQAGGTFRVDHGVGRGLGVPKLSNSVVEYDELRVGAGFSWKVTKGTTMEMEGGYMPFREFDFHRADEHYTNDGGAAYGQISIDAQF